MIIISANALTEEQNSRITELEDICNKHDLTKRSFFLSNELSFNKDIPVFFSAYENNLLVGFLTIFIPSSDEAEISAAVHPKYRNKGIFSALNAAAQKVINENNIKKTLYCTEPVSENAHCVLKHMGINKIVRSEYKMKRTVLKSEQNSLLVLSTDSFYTQKVTDLCSADLLSILTDSFNNEASGILDAVLNSSTENAYLFYVNNTPVGCFIIGLENADEPLLYGVAITSSQRGKGYGKLMVNEANKLIAYYGSAAFLDVDSNNPVAFHIYKACGYEIIFQVDYYTK